MSADSAPETGPAASTAVPKKWRPHLEQAVNAYLQGRDDCTVILTIISKPSRSLQPKVGMSAIDVLAGDRPLLLRLHPYQAMPSPRTF